MKKTNFSKFYQKYRMSICAAVLFLFFALMIFFAEHITVLVTTISVDAKFWPRIIGYAGCSFSLLLLIQSLAESRQNQKMEEAEEVSADNGQDTPASDARALETLGLIFLYILGLDYLGFFVMTVLYLFFQFLILSDKETRDVKKLALIAVLFAAAVYFVFHVVFQMILPQGDLWIYIGGIL